MRDILSRARQGVLYGLMMAACYGVYVSGLYALKGPAPLGGTGVFVILAGYVVAGAIGGATIGVLLPLTRWIAGAIAVYTLAASLIVASVLIAVDGIGNVDWSIVAVMAVIFGLSGPLIRRLVLWR